ncbi:MAG: hypothetical protein NTU83_13210 [Candidatus Hydrogenedentes bacterium]|nr:hypothetical protein [Candidatus Hydrogenedentota bacterium]
MPNIHKDFHGALSYGLQFVENRYGQDGVRDFLTGLADTVYKPLCDAFRARGLDALREHWKTVFDLEQGDYEMSMDGETLVLTVMRCPAIAHMREHGYAIADHYCEHTRIVNEAVCTAAGYASSVDYDQHAGSCVQRFWRT